VTSVYLVRHAKALDRYAWVEPDELRPLSKAGRRQAEALATNLDDGMLSRLVSSPHARCIQTLEPLSAMLGAPIEPADELAEGASGQGALELVRSLAVDGPLVACTHGDVLLDALAELRATGVPLGGPLECKKGSTWVLELSAGSFRRGRYLKPPAIDKAGA
jgi:phosphohistidine phosphatase SixA